MGTPSEVPEGKEGVPQKFQRREGGEGVQEVPGGNLVGPTEAALGLSQADPSRAGGASVPMPTGAEVCLGPQAEARLPRPAVSPTPDVLGPRALRPGHGDTTFGMETEVIRHGDRGHSAWGPRPSERLRV